MHAHTHAGYSHTQKRLLPEVESAHTKHTLTHAHIEPPSNFIL